MDINEKKFSFPEAELVKQTEICKNRKNIVVGRRAWRRVIEYVNADSPFTSVLIYFLELGK